jgi:hypothetical protein
MISVPDQATLQWLTTKYAEMIRDALAGWQITDIEFVDCAARDSREVPTP